LSLIETKRKGGGRNERKERTQRLVVFEGTNWEGINTSRRKTKKEWIIPSKPSRGDE